jgi:TolB-like protein/Flp pilus assembly protein TadD
VLPFEYLGDSSEAHLADGITDEVRGKLAALSGLEVIAGASSGEYRHTPKPLRQVARELGVRYLLVGKVSREGGRGEEGRLRVSPELVDVGPHGPPTTKWQEPAEAPLTAVFQVQADLARGVAEALGVALGAEERLRLARPPTENLAAYKAYLRGEALYTTGSTNPSVTRQAIPYYEQAVALDSGFVEAWYRLAGAHSRIYGAGGTASRAEAEAARGAAERALALAPDRPEGRVALGYYYINVSADNRRGLDQFILALRLSPNFPDALILAGLAEQGLGRWDPALEHFRRAAALDPRSIDAASALTVTLLWRRRHTEALAAADRALALAPAAPSLIEIRAMVSLARGDLNGARMVVRRALERGDPSTLVAWFGWSFDLYWVLERAEQELLLRLPPNAYDNNRASWGLILTQTYHLRGDAERTRAYADSARLALEEQLRGAPQDAQLHALHGLALAHLGRRAEAVREGERGVALAPLTEQAINGGYVRHLLVRIHLLVGEQDQALSLLEELLKIPHYLSPGWLRVDPNFQPLRGRQRFEHLTNG